MNHSEIAFTATSGKQCQFQTSEDENGPYATVVWLGKPTETDIEEFNQFCARETGREVNANVLGSIKKEELPQANEIALARSKERR